MRGAANSQVHLLINPPTPPAGGAKSYIRVFVGGQPLDLRPRAPNVQGPALPCLPAQTLGYGTGDWETVKGPRRKGKNRSRVTETRWPEDESEHTDRIVW